MPQSFTCLHYHLVFSTKNRKLLINTEIQTRLYEYLGGIILTEGGVLIAAGGMPDHVHLLARLTQRKAIADVLRVLKTNSSKWVNETFSRYGRCDWQTGYGAFSLSDSEIDRVKLYISRQEEHHQTMSYQDEFLELLRRHGIEFDERYIWD